MTRLEEFAAAALSGLAYYHGPARAEWSPEQKAEFHRKLATQAADQAEALAAELDRRQKAREAGARTGDRPHADGCVCGLCMAKKAEANGKAPANGPAKQPATGSATPPVHNPSGPVPGCFCRACTLTRQMEAVVREAQRRRQAAAAARPHLRASGVPHVSSVAAARDCAAAGCPVCRDALAAFGMGEEWPVVEQVTVAAVLIGGPGKLTPEQQAEATNGRR